jgi:hypothetical protein
LVQLARQKWQFISLTHFWSDWKNGKWKCGTSGDS